MTSTGKSSEREHLVHRSALSRASRPRECFSPLVFDVLSINTRYWFPSVIVLSHNFTNYSPTSAVSTLMCAICYAKRMPVDSSDMLMRIAALKQIPGEVMKESLTTNKPEKTSKQVSTCRWTFDLRPGERVTFRATIYRARLLIIPLINQKIGH